MAIPAYPSICLACGEPCLMYVLNQEWCLECLLTAKNLITRKEVA